MKMDLKVVLFYLILFISILAFCATGTGYDFDLWARLLIGMYFMQTGHVLKEDLVSYTPTHTLYDHEWGSSIIFYITQQLGGSVGILLLQVFLAFFIFVVMSKIIKLRGVKTTSPYNYLFYFFSFIAMVDLVDQLVRCQLFSFLLFTVFIYILELARKGENRPLWALPFIMIIWNNLHGGCIAGIGIILIYAAGELLNRKPFKKYIFAFLGTIAVLPINPWGLEYLSFFVKAHTMHRLGIIEWYWLFHPFFRKFDYLYFKLLALVLIFFEIIYIFKAKKEKTFNFDATKYLAIAATLFLGIQHVKLIPLCVITWSVFLYDDFYTVFNALTFNILNKNTKLRKIKEIIVYYMIALFVMININKENFKPYINFYKFPVLPIEFIKINNLEGNIFVNYGVGSYTTYKLYPHNKVYIDGRYEEAYYDYLMPIMENFLHARKGWEGLLKTFPPKIIVVEKPYPVFEVLKHRPDWKLVFEDSFYGVFVRTEDVKDKYLLPRRDIEYYRKTIFDTDANFKNFSTKKTQ